MRKKYPLQMLIRCLIFFYMGSLSHLQSQSFHLAIEQGIPVFNNNIRLGNAFAGGLNSPQPGAFDLNGDTLMDMVIFEKNTNRVLTMIADWNGNDISYRHDPTYEILFPAMRAWAVFQDMDCDGDTDIFTSTNLGIRVFRNVAAFGQPPTFVLHADPVMTTGFSGNPVNIQVNPIDIPSIKDLDGDGDLEIVVFDFAGVTVEYNKNMSVENTGSCGLAMVKSTPCWGRFAEGNNCGEYTLNINCRIATELDSTYKPEAVLHQGSTITVHDADGNGSPDLLVGEIGCSKLYWLVNGGTLDNAVITAVRTDFPTANDPIDIPVMPVAYIVDVNADGIDDVLAAPNFASNESEGNVIDTRASLWYYKKTATNNYTLVARDYIQNTMLDFGEEAAPCFIDVDGDGDLDMIVGHRGLPKPGNEFYASLYLLLNIGTSTNPIYQLADSDYLNVSQLKWRRLIPSVGDVNNDGKLDILLLGNPQGAGATTTLSRLYVNEAAVGSPPMFSVSTLALPITFGPYDKPLFVDIDGDARHDLLLAKFNGQLMYYRNTGSNGNIAFQLVNSSFAGLAPSASNRNPAFAAGDFNADGALDLAYITERGVLKIASNFISQSSTSLSWDSLLFDNPFIPGLHTSNWGVGFFSLTAAKINASNYHDLLIGTTSGGIICVRHKDVVQVETQLPSAPHLTVYPNPGKNQVNVQCSLQGKIHVIDIWGRVLFEADGQPHISQSIDVSTWPKGIYLVRATAPNGAQQYSRLIKQ